MVQKEEGKKEQKKSSGQTLPNGLRQKQEIERARAPAKPKETNYSSGIMRQWGALKPIRTSTISFTPGKKGWPTRRRCRAKVLRSGWKDLAFFALSSYFLCHQGKVVVIAFRKQASKRRQDKASSLPQTHFQTGTEERRKLQTHIKTDLINSGFHVPAVQLSDKLNRTSLLFGLQKRCAKGRFLLQGERDFKDTHRAGRIVFRCRGLSFKSN